MATVAHGINDVMNVEQIKSSKLFKKFLDSEQSERMVKSGEHTQRGFQDSPFKKQPAYQTTHLDSVLKSSQKLLPQPAQNQDLSEQKKQQLLQQSNQKRQPIKQQLSPNNYESNHKNLNISSESEQSRAFGTTRQLLLSHSYFQPPTPQYQANSTQQTQFTQRMSQSPENNLNLSQKILDNPKKQQFSPERFYFNPPAVPVKSAKDLNNNIQEGEENNYQDPTQVRTNNNSRHQSNNVNDDKMTFHKTNNQSRKKSDGQKQYPRQGQGSQQQIDADNGQQGFYNGENNGYCGTFNHDPQDQQMVARDLVRSLEMPQFTQSQQLYHNNEREQNQHFYYSQQEQLQGQEYYQQQQQMAMSVPPENGQDDNQEKQQPSISTARKQQQGLNNYLSKNSKSTLLSTAGDPQRALDWQGIQSQMQLQEEQVAQIYLNLEQEERKGAILQETVAGLRSQIVSLEADKAEIRTQLLSETEANTRETQKYISQVAALSSNIAELEKRDERMRAELEKGRQSVFKDELVKQKFEEDLREARNKIREQVEASEQEEDEEIKENLLLNTQYQKRQENRDDEVIGLKLQIEQLKAKLATLSLTNERSCEKLSENQKQQFRDVEEREESIRRQNEYQIKFQAYLVENERLKNENYNLNRSIHDAQLRSELLQTELNNQKQLVIEKSQKENTLIIQLDKAMLDSFQLRSLLSRTQAQFSETPGTFRNQPFDTTSLVDQYKSAPQQQQQQLYQYDPLKPSHVRLQKIDEERSEISTPSGQVAYRRGRISNENEEEVKFNSPSRIFYKPKDHNIFGDSSSTSQYQRPGEYSYSPGKRAEMIKPRDNNLFSTGVDDTYQPNPMKIGSISLSPQRGIAQSRRGSLTEMPPAGMRKLPHQQMNLGGSSQYESRPPGRNDSETLERNITLMSKDKLFLETELRRLEDLKFKSGADIRRKGEVNRELEQLEKSISQQKMQLRQLQGA